MQSDLILSIKSLDFGSLNYNFQSVSSSSSFEIKNISEETCYLINLTILDYSIHEFPVKLECEAWFDQDGRVIEKSLESFRLLPGKKIQGKVRLRVNDATINVNSPRTSYFKVANRCHINYSLFNEEQEPAETQTKEEPEIDHLKLEFHYSAMLCTSIMYLDKHEFDFQECNLNDTTIQEIMIWNRSESTLSFQIISPNTKEQDNIRVEFHESDTDEPIQDRIITVPSFAPRIIQVHVYGLVRSVQ
jgi:hypothetical protein